MPDTVAANRFPIPALVVDLLPHRLWQPANSRWVFGGLLHLCVDTIGGRSVRTISWGDRVVGAGRRPFVGFEGPHDAGVDDDLDVDWGHRLLLLISATSGLALVLMLPGLLRRGSVGDAAPAPETSPPHDPGEAPGPHIPPPGSGWTAGRGPGGRRRQAARALSTDPEVRRGLDPADVAEQSGRTRWREPGPSGRAPEIRCLRDDTGDASRIPSVDRHRNGDRVAVRHDRSVGALRGDIDGKTGDMRTTRDRLITLSVGAALSLTMVGALPVIASAARVGCTPGYSPCIANYSSDVDCYGGGGNGPRYTRRGVTYTVRSGYDRYHLDANHNGLGCEH